MVMMTDHVILYQSLPPSFILNHTYWYWVLARALCNVMMTDHVPSNQSMLPSSILNHAYWYWVLARALCYFMMIDHVPSNQSILPSSILNHAYWYWVLAWVICCFHDDRPCTILSKHNSIIHTQSCILVLGLGSGLMLFHDD